MINPVVDAMRESLRINPFTREDVSSYGDRLIYTAISMWIRAGLVDRSYSDFKKTDSNEMIEGVDINHLIFRVGETLEAMLKVIPHTKMWYEHTPKVSVSHMIAIMVRCGEISKVSSRRLIPSPPCFASWNDEILHIGGITFDCESCRAAYTGLGKITNAVNGSTLLKESLRIPEMESDKWLEMLLQSAKWEKWAIAGAFEIFNSLDPNGRRTWHKYSWKTVSKESAPEGCSLIRNILRQYFIMRKSKDSYALARLDKWYVNSGELYRIQYGLCKKSGCPSIFSVYDYGDCMILNSHSLLPKAEQSLLYLLGWPIGSIKNRFKWIFRATEWPIIDEALKAMKIKIDMKKEV